MITVHFTRDKNFARTMADGSSDEIFDFSRDIDYRKLGRFKYQSVFLADYMGRYEPYVRMFVSELLKVFPRQIHVVIGEKKSCVRFSPDTRILFDECELFKEDNGNVVARQEI